jgi:hypothetical protein
LRKRPDIPGALSRGGKTKRRRSARSRIDY